MSDTVMHTDPEGRHWTVYEHHRVGYGARAEGDPLPVPTHITICFESGDDRRLVRNVPSDWDDPDQLAKLFPKAK